MSTSDFGTGGRGAEGEGREAYSDEFQLKAGNPGVEDSCACHELCVIVAGGGLSGGPTGRELLG